MHHLPSRWRCSRHQRWPVYRAYLGGGAVEACPLGGSHGIGQNRNPDVGGAYVEGYVTHVIGQPQNSVTGQTDLWLGFQTLT
jgi:hypothetical protein